MMSNSFSADIGSIFEWLNLVISWWIQIALTSIVYFNQEPTNSGVRESGVYMANY